MMTTGPTTTSAILEVPGAELTFDVRAGTDPDAPVLALLGSPMGAAGFGTLASAFTDRTVVTYDPRGVERSRRTDDATETRVEEHADDLHRLLAAVTDAPADVFASSGGAVNALELVARHPDQVRTLVAHEPPAAALLPDRDAALAVCRAIREVYLREGFGPAMARFIALVSHQGPVPADLAERPVDPATFGLPTEDDGTRDDALLAHNLVTCTHHEHDLAALRAASTRIVVGIGADSADELAHRAAVELADALGVPPTVFPDGHAGFLGGEYGQTGAPEAFAATLRETLSTGVRSVSPG